MSVSRRLNKCAARVGVNAVLKIFPVPGGRELNVRFDDLHVFIVRVRVDQQRGFSLAAFHTGERRDIPRGFGHRFSEMIGAEKSCS